MGEFWLFFLFFLKKLLSFGDIFFCTRCVRAGLDEPVNIPAVQAYILRKARGSNSSLSRAVPSAVARARAAVIGGGPCGLACAAVLSRKGVAVTLFEARNELGGATRSIPKLRLPSSAISADAAFVTEHPLISVQLNTTVHDVGEVASKFDCVCVSTGLADSRKLRIPGEELAIRAMDFLWNSFAYNVKGLNCAVIGGGAQTISKFFFLIFD